MTTNSTKSTESCGTTCAAPAPASANEVKPKYNVERTENGWELDIKVPGSNRENVEIGFDDGVLDIKAHRTDVTPETWKPLSYTPERGDYRLRLDISESVDTEKITATVEDGVLHLNLPISEAVKPRSITVT